jgi:hypothetical protein
MKDHSLPALSTPFNSEVVDSYEYLLRLRIDRVKASAIEEAEKQVAAAKAAVEELEGTTAATLWTHDLNEFEEAWGTFRKNNEDMLFNGGTPQKSKKKIRIVKKD